LPSKSKIQRLLIENVELLDLVRQLHQGGGHMLTCQARSPCQRPCP
jgi:hypothetical protein